MLCAYFPSSAAESVSISHVAELRSALAGNDMGVSSASSARTIAWRHQGARGRPRVSRGARAQQGGRSGHAGCRAEASSVVEAGEEAVGSLGESEAGDGGEVEETGAEKAYRCVCDVH